MVSVPLLDQYGQPITTTKPPVRSLATVAVRDKWRTYPASGLTPPRLAQILREADEGDMLRQAELFEQAEERDAHLASIFSTRKLSVSGLEWAVQTYSEDAKDKKIADHFAELWEELDTEDLLVELLDAVAKGISFTALNWVRDGNGFTVNGFEPVQQKHWRYDLDTKRFTLISEEHPLGLLPPFGSAIEHRYKARSGNPTGAGVMRTCIWLYLFKNYAIKDWVAFSEVYGQPVRIGKYDPSASKEDREALEMAVGMIGSDAAGIISRDTEIEILEAAKDSSVNVYQLLIDMCEAGQAKAVLGQTLTSSEGKHGTQALGEVHEQVRQELKRADARAIAKTLRVQLVRPWVIFNYGVEYAQRAPLVAAQLRESKDLESVSRMIVNLTKAGAKIPASWVSETFGIPEPDGEEEVLGGRETATTGLTALNATRNKGARLGQLYADAVADAAQTQADVGVTPILKAIEQAGDYASLRSAIIEAYGDMSADRLAELMEAALTLSELAGRLSVSFTGPAGSPSGDDRREDR